MKIQTSELTGCALDWAVAKCEKLDAHTDSSDGWNHEVYVDFTDDHFNILYTPSSAWGWGGSIIEREWIDLHCVNDSLWEAECPADGGLAMQNGPTPLVAAMRCYVASKLGDTIEIPEELL